jgi:deoxyribonuclease-4
MPLKFGSHMSMAGGHDRAVRAAHSVGFASVQVFTKSNNQWRAAALTDAHVSAFRQALAETGVVEPVGHTSYLINLGSPNDELWEKSIAALVVEIERGEALGLVDLVMHPGAHVGSGEEAGLSRIARGIDEAHRQTKGVVLKIALETSTSAGSSSWSKNLKGSVFASIPAIFLRRGIRWGLPRSTMIRWQSWTGTSERAGFGFCT